MIILVAVQMFSVHCIVRMFVCLFVSLGVRGKPRMYYSLAGLLYRPLWTFQLWPLDDSAPTDASRTPLDASAPTDACRNSAAEGGTYGRGIGPVIYPKNADFHGTF
jgi:hypothetical protein